MKYSNERPGGLSYLINFWSENIKLDKTGQEGLANTKQQSSISRFGIVACCRNSVEKKLFKFKVCVLRCSDTN